MRNNKQSLSKKSQEPLRIQKQALRESSNFDSIDPTTSDFVTDFLDSDSDDADKDEPKSSPEKAPFLARNRRDYRCLISYAERLGLKDNAIKGLINSLNVDYGISDPSYYVCEQKITNLKKKYGQEKTKSHFENDRHLTCISFDGKRCDVKGTRDVKKEEVITCTSEPNGKYLQHFIPKNGQADTIAYELFNVIQCYDGEETLAAILADGTNTNTGVDGGAIRFLEIYLGHSLQWIICLLHYNELPFKKIVELYLGKTTGPGTRSGLLGKEVEKTVKEVKPIVDFGFMPGKVDFINSTLLLNSDQKYLYDLCHCCQSEMGKEIFLKMHGNNPRGPSVLSQARWLLYAIAILRLYIQTKEPSFGLTRLVTIVLNVYAPIFFNIKSQAEVSMGSKHYFNILNDYRKTLNKDEFEEAKTSIEFNSFMAHSENILLSAAFDSDLSLRKKGIDLILKARRKNDPAVLRQFVKPKKINYNATNYFELLDYSEIYEPPLLRTYSNERLLECAAGHDLPLTNIPCHSTNTERAVQNTTNACATVIGQDRRHEFLLNLSENREKVPTHAKKEVFLSYNNS